MFHSNILVYMNDCLLGHGLACLLMYRYGFRVHQCVPSDVHILQAIKEMEPQVIILNEDAEETNGIVLAHVMRLDVDMRVVVVNDQDNFLHIIEHKYKQIHTSNEIFPLIQPVC